MGRKKYTTEKFVELAANIHGNQYDYSMSKYVDMHTKVSIKCPKHGLFDIYPYNHTSKNTGCQKCGLLKAAKSRSIGFSNFEERAKKVHKNLYEYIQDSYTGTAGKVKVVCKKHGWFWQKVSDHLYKGCGCQKCVLERR